ncbi:nucleotide sugar dehydrogenase [Herbidospora cretacea]|uniref:nucleotide sugar dehydrogenase n=1 Tax=Herbidospora cretacea TaxID=28444 RepID=UPI000772F5E2|nr:nucleotide sugar dehydrogenase [Herbidospora cretacea]
MYVLIVGLGYVGLPTALAFLEAGCRVTGYDVSAARLAAIREGEADLSPRDRARLRRHRLETTTDPAAISAADAVVICVPTPVDEHHVPDLNALRAACGTVVAHAVPGQLVILTSTTYVGSTRDLLIDHLRDVDVVFSPERVDPGPGGRPLEHVPRVLGPASATAGDRAEELLKRVAPQVHRVSSPEAAELCKLLENSFRAVNIALANEFADIAREVGVDPVEVIEAAATKPFGFMRFDPGPGVGGQCVPSDPYYLLWRLRRAAPTVLTAAMGAIAARPQAVVGRALEMLASSGRDIRDANVLIAGVSYKPGVADARETPATPIIAELRRQGARVEFTDPLVVELPVGGELLKRAPDPRSEPWDLVIVHTLGGDLGWLRPEQPVLDATYRLERPEPSRWEVP